MSQSMTWMLVAVVGELVLLVLVLLTISWFRNRAAWRRDAKAMQALVARIRKGKADREAALSQFLADKFGLDGEALSAATIGLLRSELKMLQRFIGIYGSRDAGAAAQFDIDAAAALEPYHALSGTAPSVGAEAAGDRIDPAELDALKKENQRLSDELRITMETMSRMLNEYSTMFSDAPADAAAPINTPHAATSGPHVPGAADVVVEATPGPVADGGFSQAGDVDVSVEWDEAAEQSTADGSGADVPDAAEPKAAKRQAAVDDLGSEGSGAASAAEDVDLFEAGDPAATLPDSAANVALQMAEIDAVAESADHKPDAAALLAELEATGEIAPEAKGADVEVTSELLVEEEAELIAADESAGQAPAGQAELFSTDEQAGSLFDEPEPVDQVAPAQDSADGEVLAAPSVDAPAEPVVGVAAEDAVTAGQAALFDNDAADDSLFYELEAVDEVLPEEKGTDVEVMSELLVEAETGRVAADTADVEEAAVTAALFDTDEGLFDAVADGRDAGARQDDGGLDDLFDADEPPGAEREQTG